jgi:hypothetical protein
LGGSASAVLIFFAAALPAAPAAVELLLPITAALSRNLRERRKERCVQEECALKKMMAAEWGKQLLLRCHFYLIHENR